VTRSTFSSPVDARSVVLSPGGAGVPAVLR
jgi:hypothetical protein